MSPKALWGFSSSSVGKESACSAGNLGSISELGRSPGGGHATHSSILAWKIPKDRGTWWAAVHGVSKSWTRLSTKLCGIFLFFSANVFNSIWYQKPLLIVLPKVSKKVSFLLLRMHQSKFRRWSLCFSLKLNKWGSSKAKESRNFRSLCLVTVMKNWDPWDPEVTRAPAVKGWWAPPNSAQRSVVVRAGSADLGQRHTLLWSVVLGHFTAVLCALNRFPWALFPTLTLSSPFSLVFFSFFIWSYHTIYRVP